MSREKQSQQQQQERTQQQHNQQQQQQEQSRRLANNSGDRHVEKYGRTAGTNKPPTGTDGSTTEGQAR